jgi:osmotically-inducible protein OsmY
MRSDIAGKQARIAHSWTPVPLPVNDETLRDRVESELFRDPDIPKGQININAEHGVVVLRGELDHPEEINAVERRVKKIAGVTEVRNLLHLTGTRLRAA